MNEKEMKQFILVAKHNPAWLKGDMEWFCGSEGIELRCYGCLFRDKEEKNTHDFHKYFSKLIKKHNINNFSDCAVYFCYLFDSLSEEDKLEMGIEFLQS